MLDSTEDLSLSLTTVSCKERKDTQALKDE